MECIICGNDFWSIWHPTSIKTNTPDKYEQWLGLEDITRIWMLCTVCGHYQQTHSYLISEFNRMYEKGYRDEDFRGKTIEQAFDEIVNLPYNESENYKRVEWFCNKMEKGSQELKRFLDIGSGFGVFPYEMCREGYRVFCIEPNKDSRHFIDEKIGLPCSNRFRKDIHKNFDIVSIIHVLEHVENPEIFLIEAGSALIPGGILFVEVPDSVEFEDLPKENDEFNSMHLHFFNTVNLFKLVERCGFSITDMHRVHYPERNLRRILLLAQKNEVS